MSGIGPRRVKRRARNMDFKHIMYIIHYPFSNKCLIIPDTHTFYVISFDLSEMVKVHS